MLELLTLGMAIGALWLAMSMRSRQADLEQRLTTIEQRLTARAAGAAAAIAATPTEAPKSPVAQPPVAEIQPEPAATPEQPPTTPEPVVSSVPPVAPPPAAQPTREQSFEESFGTRWVVWVGGLALALGGIFLVQYSIEQGLLGPGVRIFLGALLAALLVGAGEWTRRNDILSGVVQLPSAHIPSILTAAGTTVAYADIYAAYALYGFLSPAAAFVLLGIVALATLAAALLHGPWLAGLGVVGAYVTPILVASDVPNYWALYIYLGVVTAAAFALARARLWRWLAITAVVFTTLWMFPGLNDMRVDALTPHAFHAVVSFVLVCVFMVSGLLYGPDAEPGKIDGVSSGALAATVFAAMVLVISQQHAGLALTVFTLLTVATVAIAWRTEAAVAAVAFAAVFAALVIADWALEMQLTSLVAPGPGIRMPGDAGRVIYGPQLWLGAGFALLFGVSGFLAQGRSSQATPPIVWAATAVLAPIVILIALYWRITAFEQSVPFAALSLLLAALFGLATETLVKREPRPGSAAAAAFFAVGAIAALALALTMALEKGWLTIALALMVPGIAWVADKRPLPVLREIAGVIIGLVLLRIMWEPRIVADVGTTPVFNWLLYGYGVPAAAFWLAGWLLRRRADDLPARLADSAAILFTVLTGFFEIRHYVYGGDIYHLDSGLTEVALQVSLGLVTVIGLERVRLRTGSVVHDMGALILGGLILFVAVLGLVFAENPWWKPINVGGLFFNLLLIAYALPAILAAAIGLMTRPTRPQGYRTIAAISAVVLALLYLSLQVTRFYRGPVLTEGEFTDAEGYTYSAVWLGFGVVLLIIGIYLRSQPVRLASAAVVMLTIAKVFLWDMAGLTGFWRSISLIGLGLVLVSIGRAYQKLLFPPRPAEAPPAPESPPPEPAAAS